MSGPCNDGTLKKALYNISNFSLVGVTEDTNCSIQAVLSIMNLEPVAIGKAQVTGEKIFVEISQLLEHNLKIKHSYDIKLHEEVKKLWGKWKENNILSIIPINDQQKILTITPEFANTHKPATMNISEIEQFNLKQIKDELVKISQVHQGLNNSKSKS